MKQSNAVHAAGWEEHGLEDAFSVQPGGCGGSWDATETQEWPGKDPGTNKG